MEMFVPVRKTLCCRKFTAVMILQKTVSSGENWSVEQL